MVTRSSIIQLQYPNTPHIRLAAPFDIVEAAFFTMSTEFNLKYVWMPAEKRESALAIYTLYNIQSGYGILISARFILRKISANESQIDYPMNWPTTRDAIEYQQIKQQLTGEPVNLEGLRGGFFEMDWEPDPCKSREENERLQARMLSLQQELLVERNAFQRQYLQIFLDRLRQDGILPDAREKETRLRPRGRQSEKEWLWFLAMAKEGVELREQDPSLTFGEIMARIGFNGNENTFRKYRRQFEEIRDSDPILLQKITETQKKMHKRRPSL